MTAAARNILLIADDFGISEGVSDGIAQLGKAHRISGTSALVTLARWPQDGRRLADLRNDMAVGLHINLTLGAPLGPLPKLAPGGILPPIGVLARKSVAGRLDHAELDGEISRQLARFTEITGHKPDFIDGHQHVHALPVVRDALISAIMRFYGATRFKPLVRVPTDSLSTLLARPRARSKALVLAALAAGFAKRLGTAGLPFNDSFGGVTGFGSSTADVQRDLSSSLVGAGRLHLVMCHPGVPSDELAAIDPITTRRAAELDVLSLDNELSPYLCQPRRDGADGAIDWAPLTSGER